ncbi:alpha/beta hydrolase [Peptoanaerobacter stomatis]|uniref:Alpha/beta hydrolase family protein n=1 Tax=Peptoanaerobacter stomatis TaxID=796937 RepID=G9WZH8_9FIRM|nr:alpha/beta hydrolase [Peptoanaerobacter stomatis]EHL16004.1 hypothetical protein HMPREF9629_01579 [Peptoanaerobacter stomatis]
MKNAVVYIHGKGGSVDEAHHYEKFFNYEYDIIGFDYKSKLPWEAKAEFQKYFTDIFSRYNEVILIANSIGAYFSLISLSENFIKKAMFVSPIVDMENLILNIMSRLNISEEKLYKEKTITTPFGENLSWEYLSYVRNNPITWDIPTNILYAKNDNMTSLETMTNFANKINANITIMDNGEHFFHKKEQMIFLDNWFKEFI